MIGMAELGNWMMGAVMVASAAICGGYGAGMMWRAWYPQGGPLGVDQKANLMFAAMISIGVYSLAVALFCRWLAHR